MEERLCKWKDARMSAAWASTFKETWRNWALHRNLWASFCKCLLGWPCCKQSESYKSLRTLGGSFCMTSLSFVQFSWILGSLQRARFDTMRATQGSAAINLWYMDLHGFTWYICTVPRSIAWWLPARIAWKRKFDKESNRTIYSIL